MLALAASHGLDGVRPWAERQRQSGSVQAGVAIWIKISQGPPGAGQTGCSRGTGDGTRVPLKHSLDSLFLILKQMFYLIAIYHNTHFWKRHPLLVRSMCSPAFSSLSEVGQGYENSSTEWMRMEGSKYILPHWHSFPGLDTHSG